MRPRVPGAPLVRLRWPRLDVVEDLGCWWIGNSIVALAACVRCGLWVPVYGLTALTDAGCGHFRTDTVWEDTWRWSD